MRGLFVTGTDTGVGKTVVSAAIVRLLRRQGRRVAACKPVATGATRVNGRLVNEDTVRLAEAAGHPPERVTCWTFAEAAAPPVAARHEGVTLALSALVDAVHVAGRDSEMLIVEGVGGLLCPLTERETVADLIAALRMPTVVVARRSLGTLNHTLLTMEVAVRRGLNVVGVVVSETSPPTSVAEMNNVDELRARLKVPVLAVIPYQAAAEPALEAVDWCSLSGAEH